MENNKSHQLSPTETKQETKYLTTLKDALRYVEFMQTIVQNRTKEGEFINRSLKDLRNVIRVIARTKNADTIFYAPHFDNQCLTAYCPTGNDCFNIRQVDAVEPQSDLMDTIFTYLQSKNK